MSTTASKHLWGCEGDMWDMCSWSGLFIMCVFTPYVHTSDGVNIGVNSMGSSREVAINYESHHHTHVRGVSGHHTNHLASSGNTIHSCIHTSWK